ncbi:hypothetical protein HYPGJ_30283 [Hyphomicrobium sp. GJ21]|nr:hypothetical protein HYPGJ_30283 [Hyphomicrobium sp. GJ21]
MVTCERRNFVLQQADQITRALTDLSRRRGSAAPSNIVKVYEVDLGLASAIKPKPRQALISGLRSILSLKTKP